jgi:pilus assembly protein CpaE
VSQPRLDDRGRGGRDVRQPPDFTLATRTVGYEEGLRDLREPDLAVVVLEDDPTAGVAVIEDLRRSSRGTHVIAVSADYDSETIVGRCAPGPDEHLSLPLSQQELFKTCIKVVERRRGPGVRRRPARRAVGRLRAKGGLGVTTLVVNLAVALRRRSADVAIVDLDVYSGDAASFSDVKPS